MLKSLHKDLKFKTDKDRIVWDNLVDLCVENGIYRTVDAFRKTGISAQHLGDIKRGVKGFGAKSRERICNAFDVTEEWLLTNHDNRETSRQTKESDMEELKRWKNLAESWERYAKALEEQLKTFANPQQRGKREA